MDTSADDRLLACWAKLGTDNTPTGYHPLLFHMTDVAFVAWELWQSVLSPVQTMMLSEALGLEDDQDTAGLWCAFLAGLHDLGKASPAFQLRVEKVRADVGARLQRAGCASRSSTSPRAPWLPAAAIMARALNPFCGGRKKKSSCPEQVRTPNLATQHRLFR